VCIADRTVQSKVEQHVCSGKNCAEKGGAAVCIAVRTVESKVGQLCV